ncbi:major facilitator superfamily domain-containing protein [Amylocarpus encephaloides]|uniref:Major facilitator superfamily domain-containing protein n=1 Tax=Amylocarpus encephaloides TaxID=45428 RepID=A0A9P7Y9H2_9HELO|nr:major facilitator superfamily domain-containing protein [Amylocarpus encephaloides]
MAKKAPPKLPAKQLAMLALCRFAEPVAFTSVFPYLPEMIESFGIEKKNVAYWAGMTSAVFSLAQCLTAIMWGRASDAFGRKPTILLGTSTTMCLMILWGLSTSLPMAIAVRALTGAMNGNVGIIRTMVAEMVPEKELQPRAFSIMPLVWSLGSIFGPSFGGFLANPARTMPNLFENNKFLIKFPFVLPNLVTGAVFFMGIITGFLFLKETLKSRKHKKDYGLRLGQKIIAFFKALFGLRQRKRKHLYEGSSTVDETSTLLSPTSSAGSESSQPINFATKRAKNILPRPSLSEVFTRQSVINLIVYTFLALHSVAYDQLLPVFMHHTKQLPDSTNTQLPFKFAGGFGLGSGQIGTLFTVYGIVGGFVQFLIFPPTARRFGVLNCFKGCACVFPVVYFFTPYTALIQSHGLQQVAMFGIMVVKCCASIFGFPCGIILLTNSASSLRILGTLNGVAVSVSAVGRAFGPAMAGAAFTWGLKVGYVITPWWLLGVIAVIGAIPIWYLEEMEGFHEADTGSDTEEEYPDVNEGDVSREILAGDEPVAFDEVEEALDIMDGPSLSRIQSRKSNEGSETGSVTFGGILKRKLSSTIVLREPLGLGGGRRLSNGLAAGNTSQGTGATSFK